MISSIIIPNICRQTKYKTIAPVWTALNRKQFYSKNGMNMTTQPLAKYQEKTLLNHSVLGSHLNASVIANSGTVVRYKSNLPDQLPSTDQLQKTFFKVFGFVLDIVMQIIKWSLKMIQNALEHPKTREYWSRLQDKIQEARKK